MKYNPSKIERKWQNFWEKNKFYQAKDSAKSKYYFLVEFPYPSGDGLHVGHVRSYTALDALARKKRMQGFNVLYPMGWDAFGLPAENYAIKTGIHPSITVKKNIATFKKQMQSLGLSFDWSREINTTDPKYYKWTQWIFLQLFKNGLAYKKKMAVNWCPKDKIVLANEEVVDGKCERCGTVVERREKEQWMLAITKYADRLISDLDTVDYLEKIKTQQINWIGKSFGTEVDFKLEKGGKKITVFTTRVDTIFGVTAVVLAPENPLVKEIVTKENQAEVDEYIKASNAKSEFERTKLEKEKTGVFSGSYCINPLNNDKVPIWVGDYVIATYGGGAVMMVPAHDERDGEFAKKLNIRIKEVVAPYRKDNPREDKKTEKRDVVTAIVRNPKDETYLCLEWQNTEWKSFPTGGIDGDDLVTAAKREVREETGYKNLKFIRQVGGSVFAEFYRPHKDSNVFSHFKYLLFDLENDQQDAVEDKEKNQHKPVWIKKEKVPSYLNVWNQRLIWNIYLNGESAYCDDGILVDSGKYSGLKSDDAREQITNWLFEKKLGKKTIQYKLRDWIFSRQHYWGEPIPIIHCEKCGMVPVPEKNLPVELPFVKKYEPTGTGESPLAGIKEWVNVKCPICKGPAKRETDTMPNWAGSSWYFMRYIDPKNNKSLADPKKLKYWMPVDWYNGGMEHTTLHLLYSRFWYKFLYDIKVAPQPEPYAKRSSHGMVLAHDGRKMSKSWGNVINPDSVVKEYGADTLRVYEMFMGPFDQMIAWDTNGIVGCRRFLDRMWNLVSVERKSAKSGAEVQAALHKLIKKVTEDLDNAKFNTAVAAFMEFMNFLATRQDVGKDTIKTLLILFAPFAPHITEELWSALGNKKSVHLQKWPEYNSALVKEEKITLIIQINGKVRGKIEASANIAEEKAKELALAEPRIKELIGSQPVRKVIFVKGRLINIVI